MTRVFVGLGGNVGRRLDYFRRASVALKGLPGTRLVRVSPVYESSPVGPAQRPFLNAAAELRTTLSPEKLLAALKGVERVLGRRRRRRWGPREIDLDVLFYGSRVLRRKNVRAPHPRLRERKFVLKPLADLAPRFKDPVTGLTVAALLRRLTAPDQRIRLFRTSWTR